LVFLWGRAPRRLWPRSRWRRSARSRGGTPEVCVGGGGRRVGAGLRPLASFAATPTRRPPPPTQTSRPQRGRLGTRKRSESSARREIKDVYDRRRCRLVSKCAPNQGAPLLEIPYASAVRESSGDSETRDHRPTCTGTSASIKISGLIITSRTHPMPRTQFR